MAVLKWLKHAFASVRYMARTRLKFFSFFVSPRTKEEIINKFHNLYYDSSVGGGTWRSNKFLGVMTQKCPFDLFVYQEILFEHKPDLIIESGTAYGGGAYFLASMCDLMNHGEVITIDILNVATSPKHDRITYLLGSSTSNAIVEEVKKRVQGKSKVLVILDADHTKKHVLQEMNIYSKFVTKGSYLIVEDSNVNGHPVVPEHGPGPMEALREFLKTNKDFEIDKSREKHYVTFNPDGYLKRIQ